MPDDRHAGVRISPESAACAANRGVPRQELCGGDAVFAGNGGARLVAGHEVESVAVVYEAWLCGRRCGDAVGGLAGRWGSAGGRMADDGDADVGVRPEAAAGVTDGRVPGEELRGCNAVQRCDGVTVCVGGDKVECIAIVDHGRLCGLRCGDAIS
jgi:hypothetical protein